MAQFTLHLYVSAALDLTYESKYLDFDEKEQKSPEYIKINPNGRIPTLVDHENNDLAVSERSTIKSAISLSAIALRNRPSSGNGFSSRRRARVFTLVKRVTSRCSRPRNTPTPLTATRKRLSGCSAASSLFLVSGSGSSEAKSTGPTLPLSPGTSPH